jgi:hypothetical protein
MTTFWVTFNDLEAPATKRFLGVAIFDMDGSKGQKSVVEITRRAWELGINPGGTALVQEVRSIPDQYKNRLITDDDLLISLGSRGRQSSVLQNTTKCSCCGESLSSPPSKKAMLKLLKKVRKIDRSAA